MPLGYCFLSLSPQISPTGGGESDNDLDSGGGCFSDGEADFGGVGGGSFGGPPPPPNDGSSSPAVVTIAPKSSSPSAAKDDVDIGCGPFKRGGGSGVDSATSSDFDEVDSSIGCFGQISKRQSQSAAAINSMSQSTAVISSSKLEASSCFLI